MKEVGELERGWNYVACSMQDLAELLINGTGTQKIRTQLVIGSPQADTFRKEPYSVYKQ